MFIIKIITNRLQKNTHYAGFSMNLYPSIGTFGSLHPSSPRPKLSYSFSVWGIGLQRNTFSEVYQALSLYNLITGDD